MVALTERYLEPGKPIRVTKNGDVVAVMEPMFTSTGEINSFLRWVAPAPLPEVEAASVLASTEMSDSPRTLESRQLLLDARYATDQPQAATQSEIIGYFRGEDFRRYWDGVNEEMTPSYPLPLSQRIKNVFQQVKRAGQWAADKKTAMTQAISPLFQRRERVHPDNEEMSPEKFDATFYRLIPEETEIAYIRRMGGTPIRVELAVAQARVDRNNWEFEMEQARLDRENKRRVTSRAARRPRSFVASSDRQHQEPLSKAPLALLNQRIEMEAADVKARATGLHGFQTADGWRPF